MFMAFSPSPDDGAAFERRNDAALRLRDVLAHEAAGRSGIAPLHGVDDLGMLRDELGRLPALDGGAADPHEAVSLLNQVPRCRGHAPAAGGLRQGRVEGAIVVDEVGALVERSEGVERSERLSRS